MVRGALFESRARASRGEADPFLPPSRRFPYYYVVKTAFILYLMLPSTRGAIVIHDKFIKPAFYQRKTTPATTTSTTTSSTPVTAAQ